MNTDKKFSEELFINFIIMMSQSVMLHLGKIANPMSGQVEKNLEGAKASIDLLVMLKEKTKGNLSEREEKFFAATLSTLQMNYVDETKQAPAPKETSSTEAAAQSGSEPSGPEQKKDSSPEGQKTSSEQDKGKN